MNTKKAAIFLNVAFCIFSILTVQPAQILFASVTAMATMVDPLLTWCCDTSPCVVWHLHYRSTLPENGQLLTVRGCITYTTSSLQMADPHLVERHLHHICRSASLRPLSEWDTICTVIQPCKGPHLNTWSAICTISQLHKWPPLDTWGAISIITLFYKGTPHIVARHLYHHFTHEHSLFFFFFVGHHVYQIATDGQGLARGVSKHLADAYFNCNHFKRPVRPPDRHPRIFFFSIQAKFKFNFTFSLCSSSLYRFVCLSIEKGELPKIRSFFCILSFQKAFF